MIKDEGELLLSKIGVILQKTNSRIIIEGHTDNIPIKTESFNSNWELSLTRAKHVFEYLSKNGLPEKRFIISGYGEHKPLVNNDTQENRAKNRRVTIVLEPNLENLTLPSVDFERA